MIKQFLPLITRSRGLHDADIHDACAHFWCLATTMLQIILLAICAVTWSEAQTTHVIRWWREGVHQYGVRLVWFLCLLQFPFFDHTELIIRIQTVHLCLFVLWAKRAWYLLYLLFWPHDFCGAIATNTV
jgi:hypothetical protein